jgi:hypothetical protein
LANECAQSLKDLNAAKEKVIIRSGMFKSEINKVSSVQHEESKAGWGRMAAGAKQLCIELGIMHEGMKGLGADRGSLYYYELQDMAANVFIKSSPFIYLDGPPELNAWIRTLRAGAVAMTKGASLASTQPLTLPVEDTRKMDLPPREEQETEKEYYQRICKSHVFPRVNNQRLGDVLAHLGKTRLVGECESLVKASLALDRIEMMTWAGWRLGRMSMTNKLTAK